MSSLRRTTVRRLATFAMASMVLQVSCVPETLEKGANPPGEARGADGPPFDSGALSPFGHGQGQSFIIDGAPPAETDVMLGFIVSADMNEVNEFFRVSLNGTDLGTVLEADGQDCPQPAEEVSVRVPSDMWNSALLRGRGSIELSMVAATTVDAKQCSNDSFIRVRVDYCGSGPCPHAAIVPGPPRLVSAVSTSNTALRVVFNEPVFEGTVDPYNYHIAQVSVNSEAAVLKVVSAALSQDMTTITLETTSQNQVEYELSVTGIQDLAGNVIAPPSLLLDPTRTHFFGTPPINDGPDNDGDGLSDALEQKGWSVNITRTGGEVFSIQVTSDPTLADTDGDRVSDRSEFQNASDPRRADSDGDTVSDSDEYNVFFSSMTDQDSDNDDIDDYYEVAYYKTSPILADTDGDNLSDSRELFGLFRNPRIADLPRPRISVADISLKLDERLTYTDESGNTVSVSSSTQSALASSASSGHSHTDGGTGEVLREMHVGGHVGYDNSSLNVGIEGAYNMSWNDGHSNSTTDESAQESQRSYEQALEHARELSATSTVTREIAGARMDASVTIENAGDIAFTISNLAISVLRPDRESLESYQPIATLLADSEEMSGNEAVFNLGPLVRERGPIIFSNTEIFQSLVQDLMRSPHGLVFRTANFDLTDELGRNFSYASQEARDRCVGMVIDRGDDEPERLLVALNGQRDTNDYVGGGAIGGFDSIGRPIGIPMDYVLQDILKLEKNRRTPDGILAGPNDLADTVAAGDDVQVVPQGTSGLLPHTVVITAGQNGILDSSPMVDDQPDVITGYETCATCGSETQREIIEPLSGGNGTCDTTKVGDDVQIVPPGQPVAAGQAVVGPGPNGRLDTFPGGDDQARFPGGMAKATAIAAGVNLTVDTHAQGDDVQILHYGASTTGPLVQVIGPGPNGFIDTRPGGDDVFLSPDCENGVADGPEELVRFENRRSGEFRRRWALLIDRNLPAGGNFGEILLYPGDDLSLAFVQDQDRDGLLVQDEYLFGSSDTNADTDADGIGDFAEVYVGWTVGVIGQPLLKVYPNAGIPDSDGDLLNDFQEQDPWRYLNANNNAVLFPQIFGAPYDAQNPMSLNPRLTDTDQDGLGDKEEMDGYTIGLSIRAGPNGVANTEAVGDDVQKVYLGGTAFNPGNPSGGVVILPGPNGVIDSTPAGDDVRDNGRTVRTNPLNPDSDGDTRPDGREREMGGDPTNPNDSDDFRDTDLDGLSDAEEESLGWTVTVRPLHGSATSRSVTSNKYVPDTDLDGLPDLLERLIGSDPTRDDTDADEITDYNEFADFADYVHLAGQFSGFVLDGTNSAAYGTSLNRVDTDGDTLTDQFEAEVGWRVLAYGDDAPFAVLPSPVYPDSDLDGLLDDDEYTLKTDPHNPDTDGDHRLDGDDIARCASDGSLCLPVEGACDDCQGSNPLRPDIAVTITYESVTVSGAPNTHPPNDPSAENWQWIVNYGFRVPGHHDYDHFAELVDTTDIRVGGNSTCDRQDAAYCHACVTGAGENWDTFYFPIAAPVSRTLAMVPNQTLLLEGTTSEMWSCSDTQFIDTGTAGLLASYTFEELASSGAFLLVEPTLTPEGSQVGFTATVRVLIEVR